MTNELDTLSVKAGFKLQANSGQPRTAKSEDELASMNVHRLDPAEPRYINFLEETVAHMKRHDLVPEDIVAIGSSISGLTCSWDEFKVLANFEYMPGRNGIMRVAADLTLEFSNGYRLVRVYDYWKEQWLMVRSIPRALTPRPITSLIDEDTYDAAFIHKL